MLNVEYVGHSELDSKSHNQKEILKQVQDDIIVCPTCGGCIPDNYPRDVVIKEKIKLLEDMVERFYKIINSLKDNLNDADKTA